MPCDRRAVTVGKLGMPMSWESWWVIVIVIVIVISPLIRPLFLGGVGPLILMMIESVRSDQLIMIFVLLFFLGATEILLFSPG